MITPEKKAKEIYDGMKGFRVKNSHRKKCAIKAVKLMIKYIPPVSWFTDRGYEAEPEHTEEYWKAVKVEIEKL